MDVLVVIFSLELTVSYKLMVLLASLHLTDSVKVLLLMALFLMEMEVTHQVQ